MDLSVIIVSANSGHFLPPCLAALQQGLAGLQAEVLLVDNACADASAALTRAVFPGARIIRREQRCGFAQANNLAADLAAGRYLLLLNPDTEVAPDALPGLVGYLEEHPRVGIVGARLLNSDGTLQHSCRTFPTLRSIFLRGLPFCPEALRRSAVRKYLMSDWDHADSRPVDWVMGACLCARRGAVEEVGLLDEGFFLYYEDIDWCFRMWQKKWEVHYVPEAVVLHHHQRASARSLFSRATRTHLRSVLRLFVKHRLLRF